MPLLGLIGNPLSHSRSPELFSEIFLREGLTDWNYQLFPLQNIYELQELLLNNKNLRGLNVTIPFKTAVLPLLNQISSEASAIGAVNTISIRRSGDELQLKGYNTDVFGFEELLIHAGALNVKNALILGSGGAAKAVGYVLKKYTIPHSTVSRNPIKNQIHYNNVNASIIETHDLIINTTPLGMHPNTESFPPIPFQYISSSHIVIDLVYNPESTLFMEKATNYGAKAFNGMIMLHKQAEKAWNIFKQEN